MAVRSSGTRLSRYAPLAQLLLGELVALVCQLDQRGERPCLERQHLAVEVALEGPLDTSPALLPSLLVCGGHLALRSNRAMTLRPAARTASRFAGDMRAQRLLRAARLALSLESSRIVGLGLTV